MTRTRSADAADAIVIVNAGSGSGNDKARSDHLRDLFEAIGMKPEIRLVHGGAAFRSALAKAVAKRPRMVVAGGGDGTVSTIAAALVDTGIVLGVLPLGTLNHFAKDLGIPLDTPTAAATLATGRETLVDVGEVNGHYFLNNSSIGLYPRMVRHREQQRQRLGRGKWPAYAWALLSALHVCPVLRLRLRIAGSEHQVRTPFLFIGNNHYCMDLLRIGSRERLDTGRLSVYYARGAERLGLTGLALRSLIGRLEQASNFEALQVEELEVEPRRASLDVSSDGEVLRLQSPLKYRIHPRALRVLVPASASADGKPRAAE
jgi:diacylglycerol kinase family enzyme